MRELIADVLLRKYGATARLFRIEMRIYHGWHRGKTQTEERRELAAMEIDSLTIRGCSFPGEVKFGDVLMCGGRRAALFDTLRKDDQTGDERQKMVDTALTADLLTCARRAEKDQIFIVMGDDDDLLPGVFVSEYWGVDVVNIRVNRPTDNKFLITDGLIHRGQNA